MSQSVRYPVPHTSLIRSARSRTVKPPAAVVVTPKTYYVDNGGSDGADGKTPATAWKTASKISHATFNPGDTILFTGGQTFSDYDLEVYSSGTAGNPVTYGVYGAGRASFPKGIYFSGYNYVTFDSLSTAISTQIPFNGNGNNITVNNCLIDALSDTTVTGSVTLGISAKGNNWTITNCTVQNCGLSGIQWYGDGFTGNGNTITNIGLRSPGSPNPSAGYNAHGMYLGQTGFPGRNMLCDTNTIYNPTTVRAAMESGISQRCNNGTFTNNVIHDCAIGIDFYESDPIGGGSSDWSNNTIYNTVNAYMYVQGPSGGDYATSESFTIQDNTIGPKISGNDIDVQSSYTSGTVTLARNNPPVTTKIVAVATATEVESLPAIAKSLKRKTFTGATEVESLPAIAKSLKRKTFTGVAEVESLLIARAVRRYPVITATEVESLQAIAKSLKRKAVATATEVESLPAIAKSLKRKTITTIAEAESLYALITSGSKRIVVTLVTEAESLPAIAKSLKRKAVATATEVESLFTAKAARRYAVTKVTEAESLPAIAKSLKRKAVATATEVESLPAIAKSLKRKAVALVTEAESLLTARAVKRKLVAVVTEAESLRAIIRHLVSGIIRIISRITDAEEHVYTVVELDRVNTWTSTKTVHLVRVSDTGTTAIMTRQIPVGLLTVAVGTVSENSTAGSWVTNKSRTLTPHVAVETAPIIRPKKTIAMAGVIEGEM